MSMRKFLTLNAIIIVFTLLFNQSHAVNYYTYTGSGNNGAWAVASTWTTDPSGTSLIGSAVPANNDAVFILNGFRVFLTGNVTTTGLSIVINNGGTLDLATFTMATISNLSGSGTLRIQAGYFPTITTNNFPAGFASGATVEYYDFTGNLPATLNYPNLIVSNSTASNHTVAFSNPSAYNLSVLGNLTTNNSSTGSLTLRIGTQAGNLINMAINGNLNIGGNTTFGVGVFNSIHNITLSGNLTNNGTVQLSNSAQYTAAGNGAANTTFISATDNTIICNGITNLYTLTVNKGSSSTNILSITSTDVANFNLFSNGILIEITNGTLRLGNNINVPRLRNPGNYNLGDIGLSPMLWIDGATVNTNGSAFVAYGKLRITAGSFTCTGGEGTVIRLEGQYIIEGGTFTTEKFRPSTETGTHRGSFTMSGGVFNATGTGSNAAYARFSLPFPDQVFIMSGGTINVSNPQPSGGGVNGGIHIGCKAANYNVTGGTFNAILSNNTNFSISSTAPFYNLNISKTGGTGTTVQLSAIGSVAGTDQNAYPLTVLNDFTINGANSPTFNANGRNVSLGRNFLINTGATYTPNANTTIFSGNGDQLLTNDGTITSGFFNLTVNKPSGALILDGAAPTYSVSQLLTLTRGVLNDGGKVVLVSGNIVNNAIHTGSGSITLNGSATQNITGDGNGTFGNLILNNNSTPGVNVTADIAVSGTLTLAGNGNSLFDISLYQLSLTSPSATALATTGNPFSNVKMIRTSGFQSDRGIRKTFNSLTAFRFAVGVGNNYTPATIQITAAPTTYGTIAVKPVNSRQPFITPAIVNNLDYYWKVNTSGFTGIVPGSATHQYEYSDSNVSPPGDDVNYVPARYSATTWTVINNTTQVNETTKVISFAGVNYLDGDFTAGIPASFGIVKIYYSKRSGNWNNTGAGTTPWSEVSHSGADATTTPGPGDQVFIGDGATFNHTITITTNGQSSGGLEINTGSTLDIGVTTGHNFGRLENVQISGSGLMRISSATPTAEFPAGDFGNFIRATGGTVEYYTTGAQDFIIPLTSRAPTSLPLISYRNLTLTPATGRSITLPDQDERIFGNLTTQGASATGVVSINSTNARTILINGNLIVNSGNLQFRNGTPQRIEIDGTITIGTDGIFNLNNTGTAATNTLLITGSLINNGIFDMSNTPSYVSNVTFTGTANVSITGTGATTNFNILTVSKGTSQAPVLNVNASAFSLSAPGQPLILTNGTFRLSSAQTVTISNGLAFDIPATARLSANGGTLQVTGNNGVDLRLAGTLEVLNGTVNIGTTANDNAIEYAATGSPTILSSGGVLNVMSQIRRSAFSTQGGLIYNQSGTGRVNVGVNTAPAVTRGVLEILNPGSSFTMSGGVLSIARGSGSLAISDLYLQPASHNITGGTIEIGTGATGQTVDINTITPLYNITVTGSNNTARLEFNPVVFLGSMEIQADNTFNANAFNVSIGGNFINANTLNTVGVNVGGYRAGAVTQTTTFNSAIANQSMAGVGGNLTNFGNLIINNIFSGGSVSLQLNTNLRVSGTLTLSNGIFSVAENTVTALSTVLNSSVHTSTVGGSITLAGSSNQVIGGNGNGRFGNLILNNASGASFSANQEITGVLTFTNGSLFIGPFGLNLSNTSLAAITGASPTRYIITSGSLANTGVTKAFAGSVTNGNFVYPIGVAGKYTPANYTITTGAIGGSITIKPVNSKHPSATGSGTAFINYYWSVTNTVITLNALTHTYTYSALDEAGIVNDYRDARFRGGAWTIGITPGNPNTVTRVITFTNTDLAGDYTTGEPTAFVNPTTYTSIASGLWEADLSVWDIDPPGTNLGPPPGSFVVISEGHTVTITGNGKRLATLQVLGRLHVGNTTGHDFGTVTTSGASDRTIQFQASAFPSGDFTNFTNANGGTVEYNSTVILPTQNVYNNLSFTGAGTKTLPNADLVINGNINIIAGSVTNAVNNRSIVLITPTGDFTNNGTFNLGTGLLDVGRNLINSGATSTFLAGNGTQGSRVRGNISNNAGAVFTMGTDSLGVRGNLSNNATFNGGVGLIRVSGSIINTSGTFTGGAGTISVSGSLFNNAIYTAGTGATSVIGSFTNSGIGQYTANSNTLTVNTHFGNLLGAVFNANTGSILVRGNWMNTGTFNAATGLVTFDNAGAQLLTGATTFNNLNRVNGGSLTIIDNITVTSFLTFTSGTIRTGSNQVNLTNSSSQPVTGYSASGFIDGKLSISYSNNAGASRVFPIGVGSIYRPMTIQQTAASTNAVVRAEIINTPPTGSYPLTIEGLSEARHYAIDLLSGTMNAPTVELSFNTNGSADENITVPGNVRIVRATSGSGPWTDEGGAGVFSPASPAGYATSGITSIGNPTYFALGYNNVALPIRLRSFEATLINDIVDLKWSTFTESNNDFFTVERSVNGITFDSVLSVEGAGNSVKVLNYSEQDLKPLRGISYYRLKQTDYDGKYSYSYIVRIDNSKGRNALMNIYPNPAYYPDEVFLKIVNDQDSHGHLMISTVTGVQLYSGYVDLSTTINLTNLRFTYALSKGVYFIKVISNGLTETKKLVIK